MPNYVKKKLIEYGYEPSKRRQYSPYQPDPIAYGKNSDNIPKEKKICFPQPAGHKIRPAGIGQFLVLCARNRHNNLASSLCNSNRPSHAYRTHVTARPLAIRLHVHHPKRSHPIQKVGHDSQHTLRR